MQSHPPFALSLSDAFDDLFTRSLCSSHWIHLPLFLSGQETKGLMRWEELILIPVTGIKHSFWNTVLCKYKMSINDTDELPSCGWNNNMILKFLENYRFFWWTDVPSCFFSLWGNFFALSFKGLDSLLFISILKFLISLVSFVSAFRSFPLSFLQGPISLCSVSHFLYLTCLFRLSKRAVW